MGKKFLYRYSCFGDFHFFIKFSGRDVLLALLTMSDSFDTMQFEDFANHNAFTLLAKYGTSHLVFNDDIQVRGSSSIIRSFLLMIV